MDGGFKRSTVCYLHWNYSRKERGIDQLPSRVMLTQTGKPLKGSEIFNFVKKVNTLSEAQL